MIRQKNHWVLFFVPVMGIFFWFLLAYPFANRNESYLWIAYLEQYSFLEIIENPIPSIRNFRPLAQTFTWILYHLAGNTGILVQLVNFVLLCVAFWVMIPSVNAGRSLLYRILYLLLGFIYIPAFYYIFNLHGIFYSPILLFLAVLIRADEAVLTHWKKWFAISFVLIFFHPFMVLFYAAFLIGLFIRKEHFKTKQIITLATILATMIFVVNLLLPFPVLSIINIHNLLGSARNVETSAVISAVTLALCACTLIQKPRWQQYLLAAIMIAYLPLSLLLNLPLLLLLGILLLINLILNKDWPLAGLLLVSFSFPLVVGSGAPTKTCMFIFMVPYLLVKQTTFTFDLPPKILTRISFVIVIASLTGSFILRTGLNIPVLTNLITPMLVEKGKTFQLERALYEAQQLTPTRHILFLQEKQGNIRDMGQPKKRDFFPPTKQKELDSYQQFLSTQNNESSQMNWYLSFGEKSSIDSLQLVKTIEDQNCRPLYIYEPIH